MVNLELRLPPPLVFVCCAAAMWWVRGETHPGMGMWSLIALLFAAGAIMGFGALFRFRHHKTTVSPTRPHETRHLVTGGVYRISRNPMYLGLFCWLAAWGCYLGGVWVCAGPALLALWLTRFQIMPEERLLRARFGEEYARYCQQVRRWC
ncbi:isoprenylcysteine carboxylmethyltransferase family protein [Aeromonas jandaei]|uniref:methyltransferase family protein n=1 Tax=Aeromonas jandaei TaxID=650 RepID=UPI000F53D13D|nr:isoprenylcysteine carboxylmethyltransferase family protein [Aeromonas jandaei]RQM78688.1 isoprenylcysteine carboxylmethyltransferase family protein [Aeromonas jandaei]